MIQNEKASQIALWVLGTSIHSDNVGCVPDFACCTGLKSDLCVRQKYLDFIVDGNVYAKMQMDRMFMQSVISDKILLFEGDSCLIQ